MMKEQSSLSYLYGTNVPYIEDLYEAYLSSPDSVDSQWRQYFDQVAAMPGNTPKDVAHRPIQEAFANLAQQRGGAAAGGVDFAAMQKQVAVLSLISAYRSLGNRAADLNPLDRTHIRQLPELDPKTYGLTDADMNTPFHVGTDLSGSPKLPLAEIIRHLKQIYCGPLALEYMHIPDTAEREWLQERLEANGARPQFDAETKRLILKEITAAETMERYLHTRYVGQKRFSLEGGESTVPALNHLIRASTAKGVQEIVIGMAHRGRLNVLVNTMGKAPQAIFDEFEGKVDAKFPSGDVKYHMGFSSDVPTPHGPVHLSLAYNPSHLEITNPVIEGSVRARQDHRGADGRKQVLPILTHGDSAFIGLGVNQATFNMSQTRGYSTGGTIHFVINNQVGFTTSDPRDTRSTLYCTDIAKMVSAPILHVNGDDPEAVCHAAQIALDYRTTFHKDIVIDLVCYRKLGHNEGDDPTLTQPLMYKQVAAHPGSRAVYAEQLIKEGVVTKEEAEKLISDYRAAMDKGDRIQEILPEQKREHAVDWSKYQPISWRTPVKTALPAAEIKRLAERFTNIPADVKLHNTVKKIIDNRKAMAVGEQAIDWGMAETIAYASLLEAGHDIRISGEDSGRGTFSHRHAVLHDQNRAERTGGVYIPLQHISEKQGRFNVIDSILNEEAVMAYEYGYASSAPEDLVIWEAQFGDFANGAQIAIDQFITSGETKWGRWCGLTVILPHGYDGQGPEHSSARVERWLQLCAEENIQVLMMSEASQMFHALRRQILRPYRKPLVIFMSKRLLRLKDACSPLANFTDGEFRLVIGDTVHGRDQDVKRVILCAGQVYYDLAKARADKGLEKDIAIVRVEQLYPFPYEEVAAELKRFPNATEIMWAQEEPKNQGAWYQIRHRLEKVLGANQRLTTTSRPASASPAVGYAVKHKAGLDGLLEDAMKL
ncbi:2-oxoglutarate dehydrogenase E1 component [Eikenella corrodens]|uniref:2-oxoglutarate dehydrogenase E1 component n=1 Tax=Eikenella corrodens TaxID=539 RepID=A0A3S9SKQ7_EIKCO|nr:2-oxoglutarate dehydrogenase E1 component [Eikenella corrodens]AZR60014.1 2-oxoglutarate dehydrogenase E1 component [Eikenella corrodens]